MRTHTCLAVLVTAVVACKPAAPADTSASARQAIDAANAQWPRLTSTGHSDSIAELFADDGVIMPPNMAPLKGKDAIRAFFAEINSMDPKPTLTLRAERVVASGAVAVEMGRWNWGYPAGTRLPPGTPAVDSGKYIAHWHEQNGKWLMVDDIWNSDMPAPPAPPPPPAPSRR
jgi:uncharacterized protein (TIGR02246 family)